MFRTRWFRLKEGTLELHYYRHKDDTKSKGFINIGDVVEVCRTTNESGKYGFDVVTSSIALTLLRISPSLALSCVPFLLFPCFPLSVWPSLRALVGKLWASVQTVSNVVS